MFCNYCTYILKKLLLLLLLANALNALGQTPQARDSSKVIQLSGMVKSYESIPLPFATISVQGTRFGTNTNWEGFYSLAVREGDEIIFSYIGFKPEIYKVPRGGSSDKLTHIQILDADTFTLKETVIKPWPTAVEFNYVFVRMEIPDDDYARAMKNLDPKKLEQIAMEMPRDGGESAKIYFQSVARSYYNIGQVPPMSILNPAAWYRFFQALRNGEVKNKK